MLKEQFIYYQINAPQVKEVEFVASEIHETKRIPDSYVFLEQDGKFYLPCGEKIEDCIEKESDLGRLEYQAFERIQDEFSKKDKVISLWFSPPHVLRGNCPSKIIISEKITLPNKQEVAFNRAIVLDIPSQDLLNLAWVVDPEISSSETLRVTPLFPDQAEFARFVSKLAEVSSQAEAITDNSDLQAKTDTYATLSDIKTSVHVYGENTYGVLLGEAKSRQLIGEHEESCPPTAFGMMEKHALQAGEKTILKCTCPHCKNKVDAEISGGKIHCPKCGRSAIYHCH